jgi:phosphopantothenoylcysteine decarboxylase/phosphopantothenate--cysteine ligase
MTSAARLFIGPATFAALTGRPVASEIFDPLFPLGAHIQLTADCQLLCIAPASADFLGKMAQGLADDLLSTLYLCFSGPVLIAPAMNDRMWQHAAVQRNVQRLRDDGVHVVEPDSGWLSCRQTGVGRMAEPQVIADAIAALLPKP